VRNRALHDQLRAFGERAAECLTAALEAGAEIPFEVAESPGTGSVLYRYRPLSGDFVRERMGELRRMDGFGPCLLALSKVEGLAAYLRMLGLAYVPAAERDRAELVLREFLTRAWDEVSSFELEEGRFERAYEELESIIYEDSVVNTVLAPLPGLRLGERWELGEGIAIVRGDLIEAPPEAVWSAGAGNGEPNALVAMTVEGAPEEPPPLTAARLDFRRLLTALRLLKSGGVTLGPSAWWRLDDGPWQQVPLGFPAKPRPGDYWLEPAEKEEFTDLYEIVRTKPVRGGPLPWALSRFEMGCEQPAAVEGLSDHLLSLRALLDGEEPGSTTLSLRLAVLCADPSERGGLKARVEQAFRLQRLIMRGDVDSDYLEAVGPDSPETIVRDVEEHLRAILRDMVCGYLDCDAKRIADELLMAEDEPRPSPSRPERAKRAKRPKRAGKQEPALESWEEVVPGADGKPAPDEVPEAGFTVRRKDEPAEEEPPTEEAVVVGGVREIAPDEDPPDWGFDDDPSDYSAAV
jgi:hypothetical protein